MFAYMFTIRHGMVKGWGLIAHAIRSVLRQDCGDFELLVVGDDATAETAAVVMEFRDGRVRWLDFPKAPHFGYANRNAALEEARGRYIAFAADDDLLLSGHLTELKRLLDEGFSLACVRAVWVSSDGIAAPFPGNLDLRDERDAFLTTSTRRCTCACMPMSPPPESIQFGTGWSVATSRGGPTSFRLDVLKSLQTGRGDRSCPASGPSTPHPFQRCQRQKIQRPGWIRKRGGRRPSTDIPASSRVSSSRPSSSC